ncbi:41224_t:CDS:2 [Gigaspora margarita]|uniref:41224_t:CDS:1 n=1 Tax=Gigaspora margarita TaxID=4874 RepID=A0ABN7UTI3_GIGMA|nr:41224_t:CDS:2 [Gigaspora margarita]
MREYPYDKYARKEGPNSPRAVIEYLIGSIKYLQRRIRANIKEFKVQKYDFELLRQLSTSVISVETLRNNIENKDNVLSEITKLMNEVSLKSIDPKIKTCILNAQNKIDYHLNNPGTSSSTQEELGPSFLTQEEEWVEETGGQVEVETWKDVIKIPEILMEITSYLHPKDLFALMHVNKFFYYVLKSDSSIAQDIWRSSRQLYQIQTFSHTSNESRITKTTTVILRHYRISN